MLPAQSQTAPRSVHGQFRRVRYTSRGAYLVRFLTMNRVVECDHNFKEIWSYDIAKPWAAIRLKNGNTLITDESDLTTREVNPKKETVWEVKQADIPDRYWYGNSSVPRDAGVAKRVAGFGADGVVVWRVDGTVVNANVVAAVEFEGAGADS